MAEGEKVEINQAYAIVRQALEPVGLYKTGLKQGQIVLTFVSPQLGERHMDTIRDLAKKTGYKMSIHPHPNQQKIGEIVQKLAHEAGWNITKGPSLFIDRATVGISLADTPSDEKLAEVNEKLTEQTAFQLEVN